MKLFVLALLLLGACSTYQPQKTEPDEAIYSRLFPYYTELCAESEINKTAEFGASIESGGPGGHSLLYLNGVCRDAGAKYPVLRLCDDSVPMSQRGVGLSVNDHFANANWVATSGRDFFFHGTLKPGEGLTRDEYRETETEAERKGIYDGVHFHEAVYADKPAAMTSRDFAYDVSIGTDFAPDFARNRYCARAPVSRAQMQQAIDYLNALNAPYRNGDKEFHWDVLRDNCTHMTHNVVAACDVWRMWPHNDLMVLAALDFPVPKNEFVNLMRHTNDMDLADLDVLYADETIRDGLMRYDFLPNEPGALAEFSPVASPNDVYSTHSRLIFFDDAVTGSYQTHLEEIFSESRYTELRANLLHFSVLYRNLQSNLRSVETYGAYNDIDQRASFVLFYDKYAKYLAAMQRRTDADLNLIDALPPPEIGVR